MNEEDLIETKLTLELWGDSVIDSMRNILISNSKSASGNLINSLNYTITFNGVDLDIDFSMPDYGEFVDKGRGPGKQPPISAIKPWLQIKGIPEKFAFPIARNIGKKGIKAVPFFGTTIDSKIEQLTNQLTIAYTKDLDNYIQKQIDKKF